MTSDSYVLAAAYAVEAALRDLETAQRLLHYSPQNDVHTAQLQNAVNYLQAVQAALNPPDTAPGSMV